DKMGFDDVDALCVALGVGDITTAAVFNAVQQLARPENEDDMPQLRAKRSRKHKPTGRGTVIVDGADGVMTQFARCCNPMPPEPVRGYITQGRGITVHRERCGSLQHLMSQHPERVLPVTWQADDSARYPVTLRVEAEDRTGLLKDISSVLIDESVRILGNSSHVDEQRMRAIVTLRAEVEGLPALGRAINKLSQLPGVDNVYRAN
ncbi:MAG: ACT domain-containing protein, partial [Pseudomonadota bacterium]